MSSRVLAAVIAASLGWGLAGVGVRAVFLEGASTFTVVVVRSVLATVAMVLFALARRRRISAEAWRHGALIGITRIALAPTFFVASLNYISAGFEGLVITLIPVVTAVLAHLTLGEVLRRTQVIGLSLGLAGSALLIASGETGIADGSGSTFIGGGLALGGVFFGSLSGILSRRYAPRHDTASLAIPMFVVGTALALAIGWVAGGVDPAGLNAKSWQILVVLALGSTLLPFVATLYAARHTTATRASLPGYVAPLIGVIGGAVLLDEVISTEMIIGGALAMAGVVMVSRGPDRVPDLVE